jgi:predicted nucleic acid-binding protein
MRARVELTTVPAARVAEVEELLRAYETVDRPAAPDPVITSDKADGLILASARAWNVDVLITGDAELLAVEGDLPFRLLSPRTFWEELRSESR